MHDSKRGSELFHCLRPFNVRRLQVEPDLSMFNPKCYIGLYLGEVPCELTHRPATAVWTIRILIVRERAH
jgi:hypothetical protein